MYLKSIDVVGYKSFAAKTHLDLGPGITGIIGPNGCGKSNIMESVRWCLGEMSWKSLRADSMVDVIFSGTAKRPSLSMTEVTLTFDNASSLLPVQFSEVTITRRIFRSGESSYFLNKTQCRLRDIRELFLDTGLGGDGYAIIDQGGVDFVLSSKPEDRRSIFEEAAGVAKYKAKREEALRKIERVEADMARIQDSLALITDQVKKLDSDARKAKLYQKYKEELAALEAAHILDQLTTLEAEVSQLSALAAPLEEIVGTRRVEMDGEGANLAALNLEKASQQGQVLGCNQRISEVKSEIGRLEERIQAARRAMSEAQERAASCQGELTSMGQRLLGLAPEMERSSQVVADAESARAQAEQDLNNWSGSLRALQEKSCGAQAGLDSHKAAALDLAERILSLRRGLAQSESSWSRQETQLRSSLRELEKDLAQAENSRVAIESARQGLESQRAQTAAAGAACEQAQKITADKRSQEGALAEDTLRLHANLAESRARAEALEVQGGQNPYWVGAQAALNAGIEGVVGTVRQLFRVEEAYRPYLEDLLGERLYAVVCEDSLVARAAIEMLQASGKGRARFLVLSSLPSSVAQREYPPEANPLLRHVSFDPRHERVLRFLLREAYALDKALFGEHWVYGGAPVKEGAQLSLADVTELRSQISRAEVRAAELSQAKASLQAAIAEAEESARAAASLYHAESAKEASLEAQLRDRETSLSLHQKNVELSRSEAVRLLADMAILKEGIIELRRRIEAAEAEEKSARERESQAAQILAATREELAGAQSTHELLESKFDSAREKTAFLAGAYERLGAEQKSLEAAIARRQQEMRDLGAKKEDLAALMKQSEEELADRHQRLAVLEVEAQGVFARLQEIERSIAQKEESLRQIQQAHGQAQKELHELELKLSAQRSSRELLQKRLWDDWQLTYDEAKSKYGSQSADAQKIEFLRKRIANMGNINMAAPEEYEALSSKETFLAAQLSDLSQAKEDLKSAIQKINGTTRENFRQTFTEVREHFRRIFGVLFDGGEADLVLTDPENILETGVEIVAQPPGKRLQSISLLSGGEKTMTAIALLFAFFMVKPSPFCMLDEADAALDDANVERFVALLREFQSRSQFLIVSHNKRTMEAADAIYGVTMEEMGVSQIISVDFRKKLPEHPTPAAQPTTPQDPVGPA
ncbi:MAG: chromosome segregation protein SMC [Elusimicrobia bacterium]|nr:chromosome segregation protein SMC [Elusimicrobiota bacterium]